MRFPASKNEFDRLSLLPIALVLYFLNIRPNLLGQYLERLHTLPNAGACGMVFFLIKLDKVILYAEDQLLEFFVPVHITNPLVFTDFPF